MSVYLTICFHSIILVQINVESIAKPHFWRLHLFDQALHDTTATIMSYWRRMMQTNLCE